MDLVKRNRHESTSIPALAAAARTISTASPVGLPSLISTNGGKCAWNAIRTVSAAFATADQTDSPATSDAIMRPTARGFTMPAAAPGLTSFQSGNTSPANPYDWWT
jgi:hypothetical protein